MYSFLHTLKELYKNIKKMFSLEKNGSSKNQQRMTNLLLCLRTLRTLFETKKKDSKNTVLK